MTDSASSSTPTHAEHEALRAVVHDSIERWGDLCPTPKVADYVAEAVRAAGFGSHRTAQGESTDDERIVRSSIHGDVDAIRAFNRLLRPTAQGESANASEHDSADSSSGEVSVQGEPTDVKSGVTIPERFNRRNELGPAIRKLLVEEARAENVRNDGDKARELRQATLRAPRAVSEPVTHA